MPGRTWSHAVVALALAGVAACSHVDPPTPAGVPWVAPPEATPTPTPTPTPTSTPDVAHASSSTTSASLPQTTERPAASSHELSDRMTLLWTAIVNDDPDTALPAFFPLAAYQQV
ncbi:MAG: hypothetical protein ACREOE_06510, partial [Gemmatimonadales bacterium]